MTPCILMHHFSDASYISDCANRQLAMKKIDGGCCVHKLHVQRRCILHWAPILKPRLSWRELWHYSLCPAVRGLLCRRAERSSSSQVLGFRGQKQVIQSDFAKLGKSSATVKKDVTAAVIAEFLLFLGMSDLSKHTLVKLFDIVARNQTRLKGNSSMRK